MKVNILAVILSIIVLESNSLIIPDEIPSLLSLIYSNIPTIKKGTDSRLGWGFRLGDRADFQVMVELGPQTNTQPLANQGDNDNRKRNAANNVINSLYAQHHNRKNKIPNHISDTEGGKWIQEWSANMKNPTPPPEFLSTIAAVKPKPGLAPGEIDAKSVIPDDSVVQLEELFEKKAPSENIKIEISTSKPRSTTSKEDALDNVDLD